MSLRQRVRQAIPDPWKPLARKVSGAITAPWARLRLAFGRAPLSDVWGADRGRPIHREYLEEFLGECRADIGGHCLEFQEGEYSRRFGGAKVKKLDILHIDASNPIATIVADLTKANDLSDRQFNCIVCTHVLHVIFDLERAVSELHRILRPGGVLLLAVPGVSMCDPGENELWRFTPRGLQLLLEKVFGDDVMVRGYGNSLTAAAELRGLVTDELFYAELHQHDPRFAVEVCARAVRATELSVTGSVNQ